MTGKTTQDQARLTPGVWGVVWVGEEHSTASFPPRRRSGPSEGGSPLGLSLQSGARGRQGEGLSFTPATPVRMLGGPTSDQRTEVAAW